MMGIAVVRLGGSVNLLSTLRYCIKFQLMTRVPVTNLETVAFLCLSVCWGKRGTGNASCDGIFRDEGRRTS